jgi:hypothetical protein
MVKSTSIKPSYGNSYPSAHSILSNLEGHMLGRGHTRPKKNYLSSLVGTSNEVNVIVGTINAISLIGCVLFDHTYSTSGDDLHLYYTSIDALDVGCSDK